jgi:GH35 family endo-1,4-beta-xylanase
VKLYYNDYGIEDIATPKGQAAFQLVQGLHSKGLVDGVGLQMHITTDIANPQEWQTKVAATLAKYASLDPNFEIAISEMDVKLNKAMTRNKLHKITQDF